MNKTRRKQLAAITARIEAIKTTLADIATDLATIAEQERESFDNLTEGLQATDRGQAIETSADNLAGAHSELEDIETTLDGIVSQIEEATS